MIEFLDEVYNSIEDASPSGVLFLDLKKAFDTVDHEILLKCLNNFGFNSTVQEWTLSYLSNRTQVIKVGNSISEPSPVCCGVPQGSIIGPLMFTLYIDSLPKALTGVKTYLYADDTAIVARDKDPMIITNKLNSALGQVSIWFRNHKLSLNVGKTKFIPFGTPQWLSLCVFPVVSYAGEEVEMVNTYKYLGIQLAFVSTAMLST